MDFSKRHREDELMDDSNISYEALKGTYEDIDRTNRLLGGNLGIIAAIDRLVAGHPKKEYSVIDVGCGNGAMLRTLADFFKERNLAAQLVGIDFNKKAIDLARKSSKEYPKISYRNVDMLQKDSLNSKADIVVSTLTLHHIDEEDIPFFLRRMIKMADIGVVINDLQRSRMAYYLFKLFSTIFIKTPIAKNDGLVSIRSGFTKKELLQYSKDFPDLEHKIHSKWAFRYVWVMQLKRQTINE